MIDFLLKLHASGVNISVSDYYRIRIVLSKGDKWSLFRLKETLRSLLIKNNENNEIFNNCFIEHFGQESEDLFQLIDGQKESANLKSINILDKKIINKNKEKKILKSKNTKNEKILEFPSFNRRDRKYKKIYYSIPFVLVLFLILLIYENANLLKIKQFFIKSFTIFAEVPQYFSLLIIGLFFVFVLFSFWRKIILKSIFKSRLRDISFYPGKREYIFNIALPPLCRESFLDDFADKIGFFTSEDNDELIDVEQSIEKTCRQGISEIIYKFRQEIRQVLILEEKCQSGKIIYNIQNELKKGLTQRGIPTRSGFFYEFPNLFKLEDDRIYLLEDLDKDRNGYLVFIFGKLQDCNIDKHRKILEDLSSWPYIFWLYTFPTEKWDHNSELIRSYIPAFPATLKGLEKVVDLISKETYDRKKEKISINFTYNSLEFELQDCLPWACACALFQPMDFGVAEEMRKQFFHYLEKEDIQRMIELSGTNCTNAGFIFSENITNKLINILRSRWPENETIWRKWYNNLLDICKHEDNSLSFLNWQFKKAINLLQIDKIHARKGAELLSSLLNTPIEEYAKQKLNNFNFSISNNIPLRSNKRDLWTNWTIVRFITHPNIIVAIARIIKSFSLKPKLINVKILQQTKNRLKNLLVSSKLFFDKNKLLIQTSTI